MKMKDIAFDRESLSRGDSSTPNILWSIGQFIHQYGYANGSMGTLRNYEATLRSLWNFFSGGEDRPVDLISQRMICDYEKWLLGQGVSRNSSSFYLRNLRSLFKSVPQITLDDTEIERLFAEVYTGVDKTGKGRSLSRM